MSDSPAPGFPRVFYLGSDLALAGRMARAGLQEGFGLRVFRSLAGLLLAVGETPVSVLLVVCSDLPPGQSPAALAARIARATGVRPILVLLAAEPVDGDGADRVFEAPLDPVAIAHAVRAGIERIGPGSRRVLLVGDSPLADLAHAGALRDAGVIVGRCGRLDAIAAVAGRLRPSLVLVDLDMDLESGQSVSARLRCAPGCEDLPVVFLSSDADQGAGVSTRRIGGDDYLVKPVSPEVLRQTVLERLSTPSQPTSELAVPGLGVSSRSAPASSPEGRGFRAGGLILSRLHFLQQLEQAVAAGAPAGPGEAILYLEFDAASGAAAPVADDKRARVLSSLVAGLCDPSDRGAWINQGGLAVWLRRRDLDAVIGFAQRIGRAVDGLARREGTGQLPPSVSIGVGPFQPPADNAQTLISRAQAACGQSRASGGNRVSLHQCVMEQPRRAPDTAAPAADDELDATLAPLLRRALEGEGFRLVYQPILPLRKAAHQRYEVLLRLVTSDGAIIPPLAFLPAARRQGLLPDLDRWVLRGAMEQLRRERDSGHPTRFLIHQTAESLESPDWLGWVRDEILRLDLIRQRPVLEFPAQSILAHEERARLIFPELGKLGIEVCLAGVREDPEVLGLVARRPIACVKLGHDLVAKGSARRLKEIVEAHHQRGARVIAAGIETPETVARVWSSGVDYIQGNYIQFPEESPSFDFDDTPLQGMH